MPKKINFVDHTKDLCLTCMHAYKGGCPVWPTLKITVNCVEYVTFITEDG